MVSLKLKMTLVLMQCQYTLRYQMNLRRQNHFNHKIIYSVKIPLSNYWFSVLTAIHR